MARKFPTIKKPDPALYRGWLFVLIIGGLLTLVALVHRGGVTAVTGTPADGTTTCQVEVIADNLNVRPTPNQDGAVVETLARGVTVYSTINVSNGYRELRPGYWALDGGLRPLPGSVCS